jgi:uncharacterized protein (TIGR02147 family)
MPSQCSSLKDYLTSLRSAMVTPGSQRRWTLERWSEQLGLRSHRTMGMVFDGTRLPSSEMVDRLAATLQLPQREKTHLELLAKIERCRQRGTDHEYLLNEIKRLRSPEAPALLLTEAQFRVIAEWHVLVVKQLLETSSFQEDPVWISRRLRGKVTPRQAAEALAILERAGHIERRDGRLLPRTRQRLTTAADVPSSTVRAHHRQMMERAAESLDELSVDQREFDSKTFRMNPSRLAEAKERLRAFRDAFLAEFGNDSGDHVFQLNSQLFEHTRPVRPETSRTEH